MANYRFFADFDDGSTLMTKNADYNRGADKMPRIWDASSRTWTRATRIVIRKNFPSLHKCDARCMNATGRTMQCECSCGGENHGKGSTRTCVVA